MAKKRGKNHPELGKIRRVSSVDNLPPTPEISVVENQFLDLPPSGVGATAMAKSKKTKLCKMRKVESMAPKVDI